MYVKFNRLIRFITMCKLIRIDDAKGEDTCAADDCEQRLHSFYSKGLAVFNSIIVVGGSFGIFCSTVIIRRCVCWRYIETR